MNRLGESRVSPAALLPALAVVVVAAVVVAYVVFVSGGETGDRTVAPATRTPSSQAAVPAATPSSTSTPVPGSSAQPLPFDAAPSVPGTEEGHRIVMPSVGIDAPITHVSVSASGGSLPAPETPDDVAFYDFDAHIGFGGYPGKFGNSIFAGHVDSGSDPCENGTVRPPCRAVFWDLTELEINDVIEVHLGAFVYQYRVTSARNIDVADQPSWDALWRSTQEESITLITCAGNFNRATGEYTSRHVVSAVRITNTVVAR